MKNIDGWIASEWTLMPEPEGGIEPVRICRVRGLRGIRYAVRQSGACLSHYGEWDFEPPPSSRTDEWLNRFRFNEWAQAANAVERHVKSSYGRFEQYRSQTK